MRTYLVLLSLSLYSYATDLKLDNIDLSDFAGITKEMQANFAHTAVAPAGSLGKFFGVEAGMIAGFTKSDKIDEVAKSIDSSSSISVLPHTSFLAAVSVPFGFTGEATMFPERSFQGVSYKSSSFALKWTFSKLWKSFLDNAIRVHYSSNQFSYMQIINNSSTSNVPINANVRFSNRVSGMSYLIGKDFGIFEPWIGAGYVQGRSTIDIDASGTATILAQEVSGSNTQNAMGKNKGLHYFAGFNLDLIVLSLGVECSRMFKTDKCSLKSSFAFGL